MVYAHDENNEDGQSHVWTAERLHQASYKDLGSPAEVEDRFYRHLISSDTCLQSLQVLLTESSATTRDYSIEIDSFDLLDADPILGHLLLRYPATLLPLLENAVVQAQREILRQLQQQQQQQQAAEAGRDDDPCDTASKIASMMIKGAKGDGNGVAATRVHARLVNLPPYCFKTSLGCMQAGDVGKIVQVTGTVVRTSPVQMYESARTYKCAGPKGCGRTFVVHADLEQRHNALQKPDRCPLPHPQTAERCPGTKMQAVEGGSIHTDYQEVKIQEAASRLGVGHIPRSLLIKLQCDLVDTCQPGDEVVVVGSLLAQWQQQSVLPDVDCQVGMAMSAHSVRVVSEKGSSAWKNSSGKNSVGELDKFRKEFEAYWQDPVNQSNPILARDFICKAICPKLYGLQVIKLALLITLIGGVSSDAYEDQQAENKSNMPVGMKQDDEPEPFQIVTNEPSEQPQTTAYYGDASVASKQKRWKGYQEQVKTRRRDQSHLLLVGDPGTGKSQVLRFAAALCPRSVLTTGVGTTSAGLTCAAVREGSGKEFALEAGALVLADKGVCCIDEFGCIQAQDRTTIHEAMEQQTLSVAKAGIVCKLNCRATIIAVMNPRDCLYDNHASLSVNTGLGTPLLSRFDLIFKLVDTSDAERDSNVTTYLLNRAIQGAGLDVERTGDEQSSEEPWTMEKLRAYISIVKERFHPVMSDEAAMLLERHYEKCRSAQSNTIPVTVRFLESLIRLSQAHARLMYRNTVSLQDAVAVIRVTECSAFAYGGFDGGGGVDDFDSVMYCDPMTVDFSQHADLNFLCFEYRILDRYGMSNCQDDDRRRKALAALNETAAGIGGSGSNWNEMESSRDRHLDQHRGPLAPMPPNTAQAESGGGWEQWPTGPKPPPNASYPGCHGQTWTSNAGPAPNAGGHPTHSVTQDHYGRFHFSSQPSTQHKRPRC